MKGVIVSIRKKFCCGSDALPPVWLLVVLTIFPLISESIYSPALTRIATALNTTISRVESTLSAYLIGFALGNVFWGIVSDKVGRKICMMFSLIIYIIGSLMCLLSNDIDFILFARVVQAIGASAGAVLSQTILRDAFKGEEMRRVFIIIGAFIPISPALGPLVGGFIVEFFGWRATFSTLMLMGGILLVLVMIFLPETRKSENVTDKVGAVIVKMAKDRRFLSLCLCISLMQGTFFSYYSEAPFLFINLLKMEPSFFGLTFTILAGGSVIGGFLLNILRKKFNALQLLKAGLIILFIANAAFLCIILIHKHVIEISRPLLIFLIVYSRFISFIGGAFFMSNGMALILQNYNTSIGTASSIFNFVNYCAIAGITLIMSLIHNGTMYPMPIYFVAINAFALFIVLRFIIKYSASSRV